jgi:hypothetical protein
VKTFWALGALVIVAACAKGKGDAAPADTGMQMDAGMKMDMDSSVGGTGVPAGYTGVTDRAGTNISDAKYTVASGRWEVKTGPAHIVFAPKDSASGVYGATTTIDQLAKPSHPEAYGVFVGGTNLTDPAKQKYGYFLVRGTGEYLVKVRDGDKTVPVIEWTANPNVPKEDASGKATYKLTVHAAADTVHFMVNGKLVAATPKTKFPTDGIAGVRINHNLHVAVTPLVLSK